MTKNDILLVQIQMEQFSCITCYGSHIPTKSHFICIEQVSVMSFSDNPLPTTITAIFTLLLTNSTSFFKVLSKLTDNLQQITTDVNKRTLFYSRFQENLSPRRK